MKKNVLLLTLTVLTAALLILAGGLKIAGAQIEVQLFAAIGIGQWFRYLTGVLEIAAAIGLFVAPLAPFAALLATAVMFGAVITHLFVVGGSPVAAASLLASSAAIAWLRLEQFRSARAIAV